MLNSRIEKSQKKVEERHFETRKQLLEYDEVMDQQRKRVYGYRQNILNGADSRELIIDMFRQRLKTAVTDFLSPHFGKKFAVKWATAQYGIEVEERDLRDLNAEAQADYMRDQAERKAEEYLRDQIESDLPDEVEDERERNWAAFSKWVNTRYGLNTNDRELRKFGVENIFEEMLPRIHEAIGRYDFSPLQEFAAEDFGRNNLSGWLHENFTLKMPPGEFQGISSEEAQKKILDRLLEMYDAKEIAFPVSVGLTRFMAERSGAPGTERYDREGLAQWAGNRFEVGLQPMAFEGFSRESIRETLLNYSEKFHQNGQTESRIDSLLERAYGTPRGADAGNDPVRDKGALAELASWAQSELKSPIKVAELETLPRQAARQKILSEAGHRYRPELQQTERSVILEVLDSEWKDHLYFMDHLRQGIGLAGYAGKDPKVEYKREGMRAFEQMWRKIADDVTSFIFRVEDSSPDFVGDLWQISAVTHDSAQSAFDAAEAEMVEQQQMSTSGGGGAPEAADRAIEPIRNYGEKVGRNSPCPCGSGKKFKNCHMNMQ